MVLFCPSRLKPHFQTIPFHLCIRVHKHVRSKKKHFWERFQKDAILENGFTGVRVEGKPIHVKSMGFQKYLDSCGRDQLTSGTNHSLSKNAFSFYGAPCFCWYNRRDQEQYNFFLSTLVQWRDPAREKIAKSHISKDDFKHSNVKTLIFLH